MKALHIVVPDLSPREVHGVPGLELELLHAFLDDREVTKHALSKYDLVFCPGNSFGHMTGGFDKGVIDVWGDEVQEAILKMIADKYFGMMPVGCSEVVIVNNVGFVYTPTMFVPTRYTDVLQPYMAMYSALIAVRNAEAEVREFHRGLCPLYCAGTGGSTADQALTQQNHAIHEYMMGVSGGFNGCHNLFKDGTNRYMKLARSRWHD